MRLGKVLSVSGILCVLGCLVIYSRFHQELARQQAESARRQAMWLAERAGLEAELQAARSRAPEVSIVERPGEVVQVTNRISAAEILERLKTLRTGTNSPRNARLVIHQFEHLIEIGLSALPEIRRFLAEGLDVEYETGTRRGLRDGQVPSEFLVPLSLRLGLLETVKLIGGAEAEQILAEVLKTTGRGVEVAYLAYSLEALAPNRYRESVLEAARGLLGRAPTTPGPGLLDRLDRDCLFGVLAFYKDASYVAAAQGQIVQPSGKVDALSVRYLQQTLGEQSIALALQAWQDPRVAPDQKEPLARVALTYAGLHAQADELYQTAINDPNLKPADRKNLIEDLNEAGFADPKHLTQNDLTLIQKRLGMIETLAPKSMDEVNAAAFQEAYKDLLNMQKSLLPKSGLAR